MYVGSTDTAILSAMTTHNPLPIDAQLSCSWAWSPADPSTDDPYFQKMAAQGQNFFRACRRQWHVYLDVRRLCFTRRKMRMSRSVGGTDLTDRQRGRRLEFGNRLGRQRRRHFRRTHSDSLLAAARGRDHLDQQGSTTYRNGPDVAAEANFDFYVCADQTTCTANEYGGTSFAAPMWAGYMALVNQQAVANGNAPLGFINPAIYPIGLGSGYSTDFHDITSGSNGLFGSNRLRSGDRLGQSERDRPDQRTCRNVDVSQLHHFCLAHFGLRGTGQQWHIDDHYRRLGRL